MRKMLWLLAFVLLAAVNADGQVSFGNAQLFNEGWLFSLGDKDDAHRVDYDDSAWRKLALPHDYSIEGDMSPQLASCTGFLPGGMAWYRKHFDLSGEESRYIYFEGVYNRSEVYLNGHLLGKRPNGYVSFLYDMTPYLNKEGDNVLAVKVDHSKYADSRWYTGSGIYRDVWLVSAPAIHLQQWGSAYRLKNINTRQATVDVDVETAQVDAEASLPLSAKVVVMDAKGTQVAQATTPIGVGERKTVVVKVPQPHRWTLDNPYLYTIVTRLFQGGEEIDRSEMRAGLRTLQFDANKGFSLNGEWMKVKGVCLHHDAGVLGAVVPRDVWKRRLQQLNSIGVNAIRMSHNPQAPALYDLCDELGLLVMDEAFDEWEFPKRKWLEGWNKGTPGYDGSSDFFEEWMERDVQDMVRRDRNHPSIFLWSIGNEVDYPNDPYSHPVLDGSSISQPMYGGYKPNQPHAGRLGTIAKRLAAAVRDIDQSRPVTGALAGVVMSNETEYPGALDVVGYNYTEDRYPIDHQRYPRRVIYGSENRHDLPAWKAVGENPYIFGQFLWTGADYLGESGPWPARGSSAGLIDYGGYVKARGWYRAALWSDKPVCYIGTYPIGGRRGNGRRGNGWVSIDAPDVWNYRDGQQVRVVCYTNEPSVTLTLNGTAITEEARYDSINGVFYWDIPYRPGILRAEGNERHSSYEIATSGRPYALRLMADKATLHAKGDVAHLTIEVVDEKGNVVKLADNDITCFVRGAGRLLGLENAHIQDTSNQRSMHRRAYQGRLLAYIQANGERGDIHVTVSSPLIEEAEMTLPVQ
ncbi:MAG: DUF4982 domain-containing protein [Prevotella sp.]|nr:DUF4982 domain-containing protein [Prevotella sp.]